MTFTLNRRRFGQLALGAAALAALKTPALAQGVKPRVVVIGGGPGGATVAKYVAKDSKGEVEVVLIDANARHTTCFFSNLYLGGMKTFEDITWSFDTLRDKYGVKVMQALAMDIDPAAKTVALAGGGEIAYDKLVLAPGIDFKYDLYEGYDHVVAETAIPHAYQAGPQTKLLKAQLQAMDDGGTVIIAAPPNPYRCPPGPYERASMIAYYLKKEKPKSKILILDPKNKHSKQGLFQEAWNSLYDGMVEWVPGDFTDGIAAVDAGAMTVTTGAGETHKGDVINMIPAQKAGAIARMADLTAGGDWVAINPETLASTAHEDIHVLGDACANGAMPKSGFSANSQAKACAMAVRASLTEAKAFPPRFRNTCWSMVGDDYSVKVGATYKAGAEKIEKIDGFVSKTGESEELHAQTAMEAEGWYDAITTDVWG